MTTTEHLQRIKAKCEQLLAIAEKRTVGEWSVDGRCIVDVKGVITRSATGNDSEDEDNCDFIASCAGPAEAGWRATIAAIDGLLLIAESGQEPERGSARFDLNKIIAAWPEEIL